MWLTCTRCARVLLATDFHINSSKARGRQYWCRECMAEVNAAYHAAHKESRQAKAAARYAANAVAYRELYRVQYWAKKKADMK